MEIRSSYKFAAPPPLVWALLMDPEAIKSCLPGCRELRPIGGDQYHAEMMIGVAAVSGSFSATVTLADQKPPESYRLTVDATGKPGFARGTATVALKAAEAGTEVEVVATAEVGGLIARVGQRLIDGVAKMSMDNFFSCMSKRVATGTPPS
ncbi:MAG TPA: carbon monoxide dehydrogenase subunit G [Vicinamibacterales bacterium]